MSVDSYHWGLIGLTTIAVRAHFAVKCFTHSAVKCTTSYNLKSYQLSRLSILRDERIIWAHLDRFGPFQTKMNFLPQMGVAEVLRSKKSIFVWNGPKWSRWAQKGPKWSKTLRLTILDPFGPFWTTLERWQACHVWPFLVQNGPFLTPPSHGFMAQWSQNGLNSGPHMG